MNFCFISQKAVFFSIPVLTAVNMDRVADLFTVIRIPHNVEK
jgi:hypothetical protein